MAKLKGTFFQNTVKALRRHGAAARGAVSEPLRHYLDARILTSSWYPEEEHLELLRALVQLGPNRHRAWEELGRVSAERDMGTVYKALFRPGDPAGSFERLRAVWALGHDTGSLEPQLLSPGSGRLHLRDYPLVSEELCRLNTAFFATVLRQAGAKHADARHTHCRGRGDGACSWELRWSTD
jgi:uncharacterized protein (TIGR02265 family)